MATTTKLSQQLHRTASHWPVDPFRPHLQLGDFLKALADHPQLTPHAVRAARALQDNEFHRKVWLGSVRPRANICLRPFSVPPFGKDTEAGI